MHLPGGRHFDIRGRQSILLYSDTGALAPENRVKAQDLKLLARSNTIHSLRRLDIDPVHLPLYIGPG